MCLAGVFDDDEVVLGRQDEDGVHVGHLPVQVHGDDCRHRGASALAHRAAHLVVICAFTFQVSPQLLRIHGVGALVDVHEIRPRAGLRDGFRGGDESVRHGHDRIARLHAGGNQSKPQGIGAASHADALLRPAKLCKVPFEVFHHPSADESSSLQGASEDRHQFLFQFEVGRDEV